jgi:hypothetical protein
MSDKPHNVMAMLMLDRPATVDVAQLVAKVGPALDIRDDSPPSPPGTSFVLPASGDVIMGVIIPAPMPHDAYQHAAETAFWWPEALQVAEQHQCHLIVACAWSSDTRLDAHIKHTVLIRGLLDQVPATAVLWGSVLVSVDQFKGLFQALQTEKTVPVQLWVKIQLSLDGRGGTIASTLGMGDFGLMEIECNPVRRESGRLSDCQRPGCCGRPHHRQGHERADHGAPCQVVSRRPGPRLSHRLLAAGRAENQHGRKHARQDVRPPQLIALVPLPAAPALIFLLPRRRDADAAAGQRLAQQHLDLGIDAA